MCVMRGINQVMLFVSFVNEDGLCTYDNGRSSNHNGSSGGDVHSLKMADIEMVP